MSNTIAFDPQKIGQMYEFMSQPYLPTEAANAITFGRQDVLVAEAQKFSPTYSIQIEEGGLIDIGRGTHRWVLDPIDGTIPYKTGVPVSAILLSLLDEEGSPLLGSTYIPLVEHMYSAIRGEGALFNGKRVHVNDTPSEHRIHFQQLIGMTGPEPSELFDLNQTRFSITKLGGKIVVLGSTGHELALVGAGQHAAQVFGGNTPHDIAAGALFAHEAGAVVTDLRGFNHRYDEPINGSVAAATPQLHEQLLEQVSFLNAA